MRNAPSAAACAAMLRALDDVEAHRATAEPVGQTFQDVFAGDVVWVLSNGWRVKVFNDCDCWDYVDSMAPPPGEFAAETDAEGWIGLYPESWADDGQDEDAVWHAFDRDDVNAVRSWGPGNRHLWPGLLRPYGPEPEPPPREPLSPEAQAAFDGMMATMAAEARTLRAVEWNRAALCVASYISAAASLRPLVAAGYLADAARHAVAAVAAGDALATLPAPSETPLVITGAPCAAREGEGSCRE